MKRSVKVLMKRLSRQLYNSVLRNPIIEVKTFLNKRGKKHKCYICENTFNNFIKYHGGVKNIPEFRIRLDLVDSNRDKFGCPYCSTYDRERHLFMYFDHLNFWNDLKHFQILHFAPEANLSRKIEDINPVKYIKADLNPFHIDVKKMDATNIPHESKSFDLVICNHVLEHIPDYLKAISEIYRVLKPGGIAILQTPFSKLLSRNFEDNNINTDNLRYFFFGEKDHFRIFSERHFLEDLESVGFNLNIVSHKKVFDEKTSYYYGVNPNEDLIQVIKS